MNLAVFKREGKHKSEINKIRRQGDIPAVIYGVNTESRKVFLKGPVIEKILREIKEGTLGSMVFVLEEDSNTFKAVIKDIQYHLTSYKPIHIDFEQISEDTPVNVTVPIECLGASECLGIKLGGVLRRVIRHLKVRCLPKYIPQRFTLDIHQLNINDSLKLSDIKIPENVTSLANQMEEVAVVIAKR